MGRLVGGGPFVVPESVEHPFIESTDGLGLILFRPNEMTDAMGSPHFDFASAYSVRQDRERPAHLFDAMGGM